jgi:hypothetical protein
LNQLLPTFLWVLLASPFASSVLLDRSERRCSSATKDGVGTLRELLPAQKIKMRHHGTVRVGCGLRSRLGKRENPGSSCCLKPEVTSAVGTSIPAIRHCCALAARWPDGPERTGVGNGREKSEVPLGACLLRFPPPMPRSRVMHWSSALSFSLLEDIPSSHTPSPFLPWSSQKSRENLPLSNRLFLRGALSQTRSGQH